MLTKLKIKFQGEYNAATKTEAEAQHNYEMLYQDLAAQVAGHNQQIGEKKALKGKAEEDLANAKKTSQLKRRRLPKTRNTWLRLMPSAKRRQPQWKVDPS